MSRFQMGLIAYFLFSLALLSVPIYFSLKAGTKISLKSLVFAFLFGPILQPILLMVLLSPPPSAYPTLLVYRHLSLRQGKTATQVMCSIRAEGHSIGGIWPLFSTKFHLGTMELVGNVRRQQVTIREFCDRFEKEKPENRHYESEELFDAREIHTGIVQIYFQSTPPAKERQRFSFWTMLAPRAI